MRRPIHVVTLVVLFLGFAMMPGRASSHREAPLISADPQADTTDVYALINGFALNRQPVDRDMVLDACRDLDLASTGSGAVPRAPDGSLALTPVDLLRLQSLS